MQGSEIKAAMRSMDRDYIKAFNECLLTMDILVKKSPEYGNAIMDILGEDRYRLLLDDSWKQDCRKSIIDFIGLDN